MQRKAMHSKEAERCNANQCKTKQFKAMQSNSKHSNRKHTDAKQFKSKQCNSKQRKAKRCKAMQVKAIQSKAMQNIAKQCKAKQCILSWFSVSLIMIRQSFITHDPPFIQHASFSIHHELIFHSSFIHKSSVIISSTNQCTAKKSKAMNANQCIAWQPKTNWCNAIQSKAMAFQETFMRMSCYAMRAGTCYGIVGLGGRSCCRRFALRYFLGRVGTCYGILGSRS